jgi:hypothetical protein
MKQLAAYPYTGHSVLMGRHLHPCQAIGEVLRRFGKQAGHARRPYDAYLADGLPAVKKLSTDLLGGGRFFSAAVRRLFQRQRLY